MSLAESLAEAGFVVVLPEHPFDTACCVLPGGNALYALGRPPQDNDFGPKWDEWQGHLQQRVLDTRNMVLPFLQYELPSEWGLKLNFDDGVSVVGHSFGAAEAVELCHSDPKLFKSCVGHDLWLYPCQEKLRTGETAPEVDSLFISSELWQWDRNLSRIHNLSSASLAHSKVRHENLILRAASHHNFHDLSLIAPRVGQWLGMLGPGDSVAMIGAVNEVTTAFLLGNKTIPNSVYLYPMGIKKKE